MMRQTPLVPVVRDSEGRTVCELDHHGSEFAADPDAMLDALRDAGALVWVPAYGGFWFATSYEVVRRIAMDAEGFTVEPVGDNPGGLNIPPGITARPTFVPGEADGIRHDTYRTALNPMFSRQRVASLRPMITAYVARAVDRVIDLGRFDVLDDLVRPVVTGIGCAHLGVDVDDPPAFVRAIHHAITYSGGPSGDVDRLRAGFDDRWVEIVRAVEDRRRAPRDDVISHLLAWSAPRFSDSEVESMALNVILGAADNTAYLIALSLIHLDRERADRERLRDDPRLIEKAVEEFLRLTSPSINVARTATRDVVIDGTEIHAGDRVLMSYSAANHDSRRYGCPYRFDLDRGAAQHLGMGVGTHFCLGAWLARAIAAETLRQVLERIPAMQIHREQVVYSADRGVLNGLVSVPASVR